MQSFQAPTDRLFSSRAGLCVSLLGTPHTCWDQIPLLIPRRSVRALFYRLACAPQPLPRQHLHLLFWPDDPEEIARRNLSHHLTHLRRALPSQDILYVSNDLVWLDPERYWCDVIEFEKGLSDPECTIATLRAMVGLYRGPLLEGFVLPGSPELEHWSTIERTFLERLYLKSMVKLIDHCASHGEISAAIDYARCYLQIDELSEEVHQRLIKLYAASGERHAALQQFKLCVEVLERELGVGPLPETRAIYQAIIDSDIRFPAPAVRLRVPEMPGLQAPLIGRTQAMSQLEAAFPDSQGKPPGMVLISGEAGIGKSRLMLDFAARCQDRALVLCGVAHLGQKAIPYRPVVDALRGAGTALTQALPQLIEPVWLAEITRLLPELRAHCPDLPPALPLEPESARTRLFDALSHLILTLAAQQGPLILCIDNLQWADASTKAWLAHLGCLLREVSCDLLVLGTYRSEEREAIDGLRQDLASLGVLGEIKLQGLDPISVLELLQHLIGAHPGIEFLAHRLHKATGGNLFFLYETVRALIEAGRLDEGLSGSAKFPLPESVREAITSRQQRLGAKTRQLLEASAILGPSFSDDLVCLVAGRTDLEAVDALDELVARQLLVPAPEGYAFLHELAQQVVLEGLSQRRRQLLHQRAGQAYQRLKPNAVGSIAFHFESSGALPLALDYYERAAQEAERLFAWQEAEDHYGRALAILACLRSQKDEPDYPSRIAVILAMRARLRFFQGRLQDRDADLAELATLAERSQDEHIKIKALLHRVRYLNQDGKYTEAIAASREGLTLATRLSDLKARCRFLAQIGFANYYLGRPMKALVELRAALKYAGESADADTRGRILPVLGYVYFHLGDFAHSLECQQKALACHQETGDGNRMARDLVDIGTLYKHLGCQERARHYLEEGLDLAQRLSARPTRAYALAHWGSWCLCLGQYENARKAYLQSLEIHQELRSGDVIAAAEAGMGLAEYHLGSLEQARLWLERALKRARAIQHRRRMAETLIELGMVATASGDLPAAQDSLDEGLTLAREARCPEALAAGLAASASLNRALGNFVLALENACQAASVAARASLRGCEVWAEIETGLAFLELGNPCEAVQHTARAIALLPRASQDWISAAQAHRLHERVVASL